MIGIIDYGAGNLRSVANAFDYLNVPCCVLSDPRDMTGCSRLVLPGVGAFGFAMELLRMRGFVKPLQEWVAEGKPFLGICLGMQMLLDYSEESPGAAGLSLVPGGNQRFSKGKVPYIGWNKVLPAQNSVLFSKMEEGAWFYFIHSYYAIPVDEMLVAATADNEGTFCCALESGCMAAVQFHPEKSGEAGLKLLDNWRQL